MKNKKHYEYILFDWDGCLAQTLEIWLNAYKVVFAEYSLYPSDREIAQQFGNYKGAAQFRIKDVEEFVIKVTKRADSDARTVKLYDNIIPLLNKLKNKKKALLSSSPKGILYGALKHNNLFNYFDVILSAEDVIHHKPHPEMLEKGLSLIKGRKDSAIMVGDSNKDLGAANNARIDSLLFYPKDHAIFYDLKDLESYKPTYIISDFKDALSILGE